MLREAIFMLHTCEMTSEAISKIAKRRNYGLYLCKFMLISAPLTFLLFLCPTQVDVYGNGWVPFIQIAPLLPNALLEVYEQRAELIIVSQKYL